MKGQPSHGFKVPRGNIALPILGIVLILLSAILHKNMAVIVGLIGAVILIFGIFRMFSGRGAAHREAAAPAVAPAVLAKAPAATVSTPSPQAPAPTPAASAETPRSTASAASPTATATPAATSTPATPATPIQSSTNAPAATAPATSLAAYCAQWPSNHGLSGVTCHVCGNGHIAAGKCQSCGSTLFLIAGDETRAISAAGTGTLGSEADYRSTWPGHFRDGSVTCHQCGNVRIVAGTCVSCGTHLFKGKDTASALHSAPTAPARSDRTSGAMATEAAYRAAWPSNATGSGITCNRCGNQRVVQGTCQSCNTVLHD